MSIILKNPKFMIVSPHRRLLQVGSSSPNLCHGIKLGIQMMHWIQSLLMWAGSSCKPTVVPEMASRDKFGDLNDVTSLKFIIIMWTGDPCKSAPVPQLVPRDKCWDPPPGAASNYYGQELKTPANQSVTLSWPLLWGFPRPIWGLIWGEKFMWEDFGTICFQSCPNIYAIVMLASSVS